jgi:hypothetical protein
MPLRYTKDVIVQLRAFYASALHPGQGNNECGWYAVKVYHLLPTLPILNISRLSTATAITNRDRKEREREHVDPNESHSTSDNWREWRKALREEVFARRKGGVESVCILFLT